MVFFASKLAFYLPGAVYDLEAELGLTGCGLWLAKFGAFQNATR
jgi:hypothetical protein